MIFLIAALAAWHLGTAPAASQTAQPGFPLPPVVTNLPPRSYTVAWDASPDPTVIDYSVAYWTNGGLTNVQDAGFSTTTTISNLARGPIWFFAVKACDGAGDCSPWSDPVPSYVPGPVLTNWVTLVTMPYAVSTDLFHWQTNTVTIFQQTNSPAPAMFWRRAGELQIQVKGY